VPVVAGVDSSTSATKVVLCDAADGHKLGTGRCAHAETTPPRSEQLPREWWAALRSAFAQALAEARGPSRPGATAGGGEPRLRAVSVAAQQHGLVVLDEALEVIRPAKLWNDTESAADSDALVRRLGGPSAWMEACGSVPRAAFTISKLAWLKRVETASFEALRHVALPHDWLVLQLCGELVTDRGDASGTGYFSAAEERWRPDLLELVDARADWEDALPRLLGPSQAAGELRRATELGLPGGTELTVGPGTGDNMAASLGLGVGPGDLAVSIGTSGTVFTVADEMPTVRRSAVAGFADATGRFLPLVCTLNAAKVIDTFSRFLGVDHDGFDELVLQAPPGAGGVVLVPYLDGERTPNLPAASGMLRGIRSTTSRSDVARACIEGVLCGLLEAMDELVASDLEISGTTFVVGGGARMSAVPQLLADLSGRPVLAVTDDEVVARGAAVQAAAVLSGTDPLSLARSWEPTKTREFAPRRIDSEVVRKAYAAARRMIVAEHAEGRDQA
jgi:xylulokinase